MAPSMLSTMAFGLLLLLFSVVSAQQPIKEFDFNVEWVTGNPDNAMDRPVMGINGQWPIPPIHVDMHDRVILTVHNNLGNQSTSLHFHGLYLYGQNEMDGPAGVTQCDIPPGGSFKYNFTVDQPGTYWYHSHVRGQYPDGLRGPFIVNDPSPPFKFDEEMVLTLSDWYHEEMQPLIAKFLSVTNPTGAEPVPDNALMNETQNLPIKVKPNTTYYFRLINMGAFAAQYFWIEGHKMSIVEVDGVYTEPTDADQLYVTVAQRYGFLVTTGNDTSANFPVVGSMDQDLFDVVPDGLNPNVTGWLVYNDQAPMPDAQLVDEFDPFDDFTLAPQDGMELLGPVTRTVQLDMKMDNYGDGANYAFFNDESYFAPKVPTLYSVLTTGENATNPAIYGVNTNAYMLEKDEVVELILNNDDPGKHPFHLHGHAFQAVVRSDEEAGFYSNDDGAQQFPMKPMRRDTLLVRPNGHFVVRFKADNPGIWLFHCHIEWHVVSGLIATMIEAPLEMQKTIGVPKEHYDVCDMTQTPVKGNAAGNTVDLLDLTGNTKVPGRLPAGFTARGIVALVFSVVAAFLGIAMITWYGIAPLSSEEMEATRNFVARAGIDPPTN